MKTCPIRQSVLGIQQDAGGAEIQGARRYHQFNGLKSERLCEEFSSLLGCQHSLFVQVGLLPTCFSFDPPALWEAHIAIAAVRTSEEARSEVLPALERSREPSASYETWLFDPKLTLQRCLNMVNKHKL